MSYENDLVTWERLHAGRSWDPDDFFCDDGDERGRQERRRRLEEYRSALACDGRWSGIPKCVTAAARASCRERKGDGCPLKARDVLRKALVRAGVPQLHLDRVLDGQADGRNRAMAPVRAWWASSSWGLVLSGSVGVGKTTAAAWATTMQEKEDDEGGLRFVNEEAVHWHPVRWKPAGELNAVSRFKAEDLGPLMVCGLLVLDDLGLEHENQTTLIDALADARYSGRGRLIVTTNLGLDRFRERYGVRLTDRLRDGGKFIEIAGPSLRGPA